MFATRPHSPPANGAPAGAPPTASAAPTAPAPPPAPPPAGALARLSRNRGAAVLLLGLAVALLVGLLGWRYADIRHDNDVLLTRRASERANAVATQLRDTIAATVFQADALHNVARLLTEARLAGNKPAELALRPYLAPAGGTFGPDVVQISAASPGGTLLWSNLDWNLVGEDVRDRDFIAAFAKQQGLQSFVGAPVKGRFSNQWSIHLARGVRDANGALRAITVVALNATMLERLCRNIALAPDDAAMLLRNDGLVLMRRDTTHLGEMAAAVPSGAADYTATQPIAGTDMAVRVTLSQAAQRAALEQVRQPLWQFDLLRDGAIILAVLALGGALLLVRRSLVADTRAQDETWFQSVIDEMADGVVVFDRLSESDLSIAFANRAASEMFGYSKLRLDGRDFTSLVHPDDREWVAARKYAAWHEHSLHAAEYRLQRPDRATLWVRASSVVTANPQDPARLRMITTLRNVTEEHEKAATLAEARARLDRILNIIPGVFYHLTADRDGVFTPLFVSESATLVFGVSQAEASQPGFLVQRVRRAGGDLATLRNAALDKAPPGGVAVAEYPANDGKRLIWLRDIMRGVRQPDGSLEIVGFLTDATAEHAADEARKAAEAQMQRLNWALTAYSRSLSSLVRSGALEELVARVCESIVTQTPYIQAWVGVPEQGPGKPVRIVASAGSAKGYTDGLKISWSAEEPEGLGPTGTALREGSSTLLKDSLTDPSYAPWRERGQRYGIRSSVTLSSKVGERVVAVLVVYASVPDAFGADEFALFQRLADEIGFTIALDEERSRMQALEARRWAAEENLRAAVDLGPGLLYRARVHPDRVEVLDVFGNPERLTRELVGADGDPASLGAVLGAPEPLAALRRLNRDAALSGEYAVPAAGGATHWVRNAAHLTGRLGEAIEVVGYISDVTREKQEQLNHQQMTTLLTLGELATGMAHELNQPLSSINFAAQNLEFLLGREPLDLNTVSQKVDAILAQAERASKLVAHMRIFARNEPAAVQPVSWHAALSAALDILGHKLRECHIIASLPDDLPPVMGWQIPMEQVLINLIGNAAEAYEAHPPAGERAITVAGFVQEQSVVLRVSDHAGGIPPEVLPRVFEPFFTTKPAGKGTGIGLALARTTITEMGGTIAAANEDGGAVFEIRLPPAASGST